MRIVRGLPLFVLLAMSSGCRAAPPSSDAAAGTSTAVVTPSAPIIEESPPRERPVARRGLGSLKARVPGTNELVGGIALVSHKVDVVVRDGFARTEIEEVFRNDGDRALEGVFTFAVPASAAITRLALDVNGKLVEGELEEQKRAGLIFRGIVDDTVRPRDPALLQQKGGSVELRIFPMPAHGSRRVVIAYDEVLAEANGKGSYTLPLSVGKERETKIDLVAVQVTVDGATSVSSDDTVTASGERTSRVTREARDVAPESDVVVKYQRPASSVARYTPRPGEAGAAKGETASGFVSARIAIPDAPTGAASGPFVYVVDVGHGQPAEALVDAWEIVDRSLARQAPGTEFAVLACDTACASFPANGVARADGPSRASFSKWSNEVVSKGASDIAGGLVGGARRAGEKGTLVWLGRGTPTAGELSATHIGARVKSCTPLPAEVHFVAIGPFADESTLRSVAQAVGGSYARSRGGDAVAQASRLARPMLKTVKLTVPAGLTLVAPDPLPSLVAGDEVVVTGRAAGDVQGEVSIEGTLAGAAVRAAVSLDGPRPDANALLEKLWARDRIASLHAAGVPELDKEIVKLSKTFHVLSPKTSFLVLENEAMFASFGVQRTSRRADDQADQAFGGAVGAAAPASAGAAADRQEGLGGGGLSGIGAAAPGLGLGSGSGRLGGDHMSRQTVQLRLGAMTVSPGLPREVIQRIVRQNFGRLRLCAERGLQVDPNAVGRATLGFTIGVEGNVVATAGPTVSGLSNATGQCMASSMRGLSFPQPEKGPVQVSFPVTVAVQDAPPSRPMEHFHAPSTNVSVVAGTDAWMSGGDDELTKLARARDQAPTKRAAHEAVILATSRKGRDASDAARAWVDSDPDDLRAHTLYAEALAGAGHADQAARQLGIVAALDAANPQSQLAAARAFAVVADVRRACAHLRAASSAPDATPAVRVAALSCRMDVLADPSAREEAKTLAEKSAAFKAIAEGTKPEETELGARGALRFDLKCDACPAIAIIAPNGRVVSGATPSKTIASKHHVESALSMSGVFRVVFVGTPPSDPVDLVVTTPNGPQTIKVPANTRTLASVNVELPSMFAFGIGSGRL